MKHNFNPGPSILPKVVFEEAAQAVKDLHGTGLSILEISHRSAEFKSILAESKSLVKELFNLDSAFEVLFLTGGASSQFFMTAMNLLGPDQRAAYIDTGSWSKKAIKEASAFGKVHVVASSADRNYTYLPGSFDIPDDAVYVHITSNNTIFGTQFHTWPETDIPLVSDMSSDIFSRPLDHRRFGLIYAGAQKNLGPAGVTLVIINKERLGKAERHIPTMLDYETHIAKDSAFNTPPVFPIYVSMLNLRWLKSQGGVEKIAQKNREKAGLLYDAIDKIPLFRGTVEKAEDRSLMNATFVLTKPGLEGAFLEACSEADIVGIKGHRSVGGFRASMYNAMGLPSVRLLVDVMQDFAKRHG